MDNTRLHRKTEALSYIQLGFVLACAAFALGALIFAMLRQYIFSDVLTVDSTEVWLICVIVLFADAASALIPSPAVFSILFSLLGGAAAAFVSYLEADLALLSVRFAAFASAIFVYCFGVVFVSSRVFVISPKLRPVLCLDRRVRALLTGLWAGLLGSVLVLTALLTAMYIMPL